MNNHRCRGCGRSNLAEADFEYTATGRRRKHCRWCCKFPNQRDLWSPKTVNASMSVLGRGR